MGKKTNWTLSEDQALCRAWLCASDATLGAAAAVVGTDQKAGTFWGVVHQLFHSELETSVDRPITGLKIRWTRINRDVQRFALAFARVQSQATETETTENELERERRWVEEAAELYLKEQGSKFTFESCWRLLRFSPRWMQLLANAAGVTTSVLHTNTSLSESASVSGINATTMTMALQKRRLGEMLEAHTSSLASESSNAYLAAIAHELSRQSDLLEEQNAIALFRMELDLIEDDVARTYFTSLRQTYAKRMRREEPTERDETSDQTGDEETSGVAKETADL